MVSSLTIIGVAMQLTGVVVAGVGAWQTWHEFSTEPFWEFAARPARKGLARAAKWVRRVLRRPVTIKAGAATIEINASVSGRGRVGFREIPDDQSVDDSITELDQRTRRLLDQLQNASEHFSDEITQVRDDLESLGIDVLNKFNSLADSDRRVATSGIRLEAVGLFLIAVGLVLQGLGSLTPTQG